MLELPSNYENKPQIDLSLNQVGVVILFNSEVIYHNQTRGTACMQRYAEGVLLLPTDPLLVVAPPFVGYQCPVDAGLRKMEWDAVAGIDNQRADAIDELLQVSGFTKGIAVDRSRLAKSEEAWVYVTLEPLDNVLYSGFGRCNGILVWNNSD